MSGRESTVARRRRNALFFLVQHKRELEPSLVLNDLAGFHGDLLIGHPRAGDAADGLGGTFDAIGDGIVRRLSKGGGPAGIRTQDQGIHAAPKFPSGVDYLFTLGLVPVGCGTLNLSLRALQPSGSLCTFRRCTAGLAQDCHQRCRP